MARHLSKTVLLTGASTGFGRQIALALTAAGHTVFGTSRSDMPNFGAAENPVRMLRLDISDDASVAECMGQIAGQAQHIDVLINNAGVGLAGALEDCTLEEIRWQMEVNFFGTLRMIQQVLPLMRRQGVGRIITIGSMAGHASLPYQAAYSASKFGLEAINEALRLELCGSGIDATIICPGDFKTDFTGSRLFAARARSEVHAAQLETTVGIYEEDERNGAAPQKVAELILRLIDAKRLRVRYFVGRFDQRLGMWLKRWLPAGLFERLMRKIYQLP